MEKQKKKNLYSSILDYDILLELIYNDDAIRTNIAQACKEDFWVFYNIMFLLHNTIPLHTPACIQQMAMALQEVADKGNHSLVINCPPGYGKTQITTYWMAWCLIRNPEIQFLYTNSVYKSVKQRGTELKNLIKSKITYKIFGLSLSYDSKGGEQFRIQDATARSGYIGVSYKAGATGIDAGNAKIPTFGGGLVIDDPLPAGDIRSDVAKERMREDYKRVFSTRPRGMQCQIVILAQRLCVDDIFATIKEEEEAGVRKWKWCIIKALDENNQSTYPQNFPTEKFLLMSQMYSLRETWFAQYQQNPIVPSGELIKVEWFKEYRDSSVFNIRSRAREVFITGDTAIGTKNTNDFTVFCLWLLVDHGLYLLDMIRGRWNATEQIAQARAFWNKHAFNSGDKTPKNFLFDGAYLSCFYIEGTDEGKAIIDMIRSGDGNTYIPVSELKADKSKLTRVERVLPYIESGYVYLPYDKIEITKAVKLECLSFTRDDTHEHDDIVDNLAYAINRTLLANRFSYPLQL